MSTVNYGGDGSIGLGTLLGNLRRRARWIVIGTVVGVLLAAGYLLVVPTTHTGTAEVNITAVSTDPVIEGRSAASLIDLPTERQLATSSRTAEQAAAILGEGWTATELMQGISVEADPDGTVLRISYTDEDYDRAIAGADQLALAYLEVRTSLVVERAQGVFDSIDEQIANTEDELQKLLASGDAGTVSGSVREGTLRQAIEALQLRRVTWSALSVQAGQVITPASASSVEADPSRTKIFLLGLFSGLFLGVLLALVRHGVARNPAGDEEMEVLMDAPVWRPVGPIGDDARWGLAAEMVRHANRDYEGLAILVDGNTADGLDAATAVAKVEQAAVIDINTDPTRVLRALNGLQSAVLVVPLTWRKVDLTQLLVDIQAVGVTLIGTIVVQPIDAEIPDTPEVLPPAFVAEPEQKQALNFAPVTPMQAQAPLQEKPHDPAEPAPPTLSFAPQSQQQADPRPSSSFYAQAHQELAPEIADQPRPGNPIAGAELTGNENTRGTLGREH